MKEFLEMSGYAAYVWSAYGIAVGGLGLNIWLAHRQMRQARVQARRRLAMQDSP
jgi:heme exporter protein CcmD